MWSCARSYRRRINGFQLKRLKQDQIPWVSCKLIKGASIHHRLLYLSINRYFIWLHWNERWKEKNNGLDFMSSTERIATRLNYKSDICVGNLNASGFSFMLINNIFASGQSVWNVKCVLIRAVNYLVPFSSNVIYAWTLCMRVVEYLNKSKKNSKPSYKVKQNCGGAHKTAGTITITMLMNVHCVTIEKAIENKKR